MYIAGHCERRDAHCVAVSAAFHLSRQDLPSSNSGISVNGTHMMRNSRVSTRSFNSRRNGGGERKGTASIGHVRNWWMEGWNEGWVVKIWPHAVTLSLSRASGSDCASYKKVLAPLLFRITNEAAAIFSHCPEFRRCSSLTSFGGFERKKPDRKSPSSETVSGPKRIMTMMSGSNES